VKALKLLSKISLRDVLLVSGISMIGYGISLFQPWLAFTVVGALMLIGGIFMEAN
jgi:hypothetical protein